MKETRQQIRNKRRLENKRIRASVRKAKHLTLASDANALNNSVSSRFPAIQMFCIDFSRPSEKVKKHAYIQCCHELAEVLIQNSSDGRSQDIQWTVFIRESPDDFPAEKWELMKIATRIFKKAQPTQVYGFLEMTPDTFNTPEAVEEAIDNFMTRICESDADKDFEWLADYIYRET